MNPVRKILVGSALTIAAVTGGAVGASVIGVAHAQTSTSTSTTSTSNTSGSSSATAATPPDQSNMPAHGSQAHESAEKAVTGTAATQAQAAAVKSVGSGTAGAVTNDFRGNGYEVTVTKSDGSQVEVHLDSTFTVMNGPGGGHDAGTSSTTGN